jgi:hypothetical protein
VAQHDGVFTLRTATGQQRTVHPTNHREALHLTPETAHPTGTQTPDPDAA